MSALIFQHGRHSLIEFAKALGLDPKRHITAITIEASIKDVTRITIKELEDLKQHGGVCEVVKRYKLEPIPEAMPEEPKVKFREFLG
jgi:hypothetical protein